jgi:mono/diheme cytochrome c family protein
MLLLVATTIVVDGQTVDLTPTVVVPSMSGREIFKYYCASCHGRDGRGKGPVAAALKVRPTDLTKLAANNAGVFPADRMKTVLAMGPSNASSHGSLEMPIWGPIFQALDPSDLAAEARVHQLSSFVRSLQVK